LIAAILYSTVPARQSIHTIVLSVVLACAAWSAAAHGGEDHGTAETPAAISLPVAARAYAQTEDFELVVQIHGSDLNITLDRFATNVPVVDAQIEVESGSAFKAQAQQVAPGVYTVRADALAAPGTYALSFSIQTEDAADLLATTLDTSAPVQTLAHVHSWREWISWILSGLVLAAGLALVVVRRRRWARKHSH
jgi:hypothetical protein